MKLNTGPDLGVLHFVMARAIIPLARAAQTGSFGVTESERRDGCNYQQKAPEIKRLKCRLRWQTSALSLHSNFNACDGRCIFGVHDGVCVFLQEGYCVRL